MISASLLDGQGFKTVGVKTAQTPPSFKRRMTLTVHGVPVFYDGKYYALKDGGHVTESDEHGKAKSFAIREIRKVETVRCEHKTFDVVRVSGGVLLEEQVTDESPTTPKTAKKSSKKKSGTPAPAPVTA